MPTITKVVATNIIPDSFIAYGKTTIPIPNVLDICKKSVVKLEILTNPKIFLYLKD